MNRFLCCSLGLLGLALLVTPAQAQVFYSSYYAPTYAPAYAPTMVAPTTVYYPNRVTSYYAPSAVPVTSYMAPSYAPLPVTNYYAATPVTSYYAPTPVTSYYAPTVPALAPVYYGAPAAVVRSTVYYPGQPIRNTLRAIAY